MKDMKLIIDFIRELYGTDGSIPLHAPVFIGNEKHYLAECIDSTYVSYVGEFVTRFEKMVCDFTGAHYAVATTSGTTALFTALLVAGVRPGELVITQSLTFVGTVNPIIHAGAEPVFVDVDFDTFGMSPDCLEDFLSSNCIKIDGVMCETWSGKKIAAILPVHIFGNPCEIDKLRDLSDHYKIPLIEDAAESLGSFYMKRHTGTFGTLGILSFNGNKIVTTGGGGMIITDDENLAEGARKLTTTAKRPHPYEFFHDEVAFNYRMPNLNAAVGCAQMESLDYFIKNKAETAEKYRKYFEETGIDMIAPIKEGISNNWLNAIMPDTKEERDILLEESNKSGVMLRPVWTPMHLLPMFKKYWCDKMESTNRFDDVLVCLPSSVRISSGNNL